MGVDLKQVCIRYGLDYMLYINAAICCSWPRVAYDMTACLLQYKAINTNINHLSHFEIGETKRE